MNVVMMGTGTFAEPTFQALLASPHRVVGLVTQPDRAVGAERGSTRQTGVGMKAIAEQRGIPVFQPQSVNTPEGVAGVQALRPELLVVAAYGQILSRDVLAVPPHGGINVHASLLPKYRGAAPVAWAIYNGERQTGVTIIRMSVALDAGEMLAQEAVDIGPHETAGELEARLAQLGAAMAVAVIEQLAAGTARGIVQDSSQVTKAPKLKKEHGLIDWTRTAEQVCRQIYAMQPWPTAYTFLHRGGKPPVRVIITKAGVADAGLYWPPIPPGTIIKDPSDWLSLYVTAGLVAPDKQSVVLVTELQPAGKRRMTDEEFLRGHPLGEGDRFGAEAP
jgi:methionyl-tRNA formyltransferase